MSQASVMADIFFKKYCKAASRLKRMLYIGAVTLLLFRKDARLPVQLQRAMAAEAEAAREARAKVQFDQKLVKMVCIYVF